MIKLIATDMDGTFLDKSGRYDKKRLKTLLEQCKEKGIYFVVASGRCLLSIKELFAEFQEEIIFLAENGGVVEYRGEILYEETMPRETYLRIVGAIQASQFQNTNTVHLSGKKASYVYTDIGEAYQAFLEHYSPKLVKLDDFSRVADQVYKVGASFSYDELHMLRVGG
ncbi:HAD-IIB family hydrolase [Streptococcus cameli]